MYDTICSLPLTSDLIALAIHPSTPVISVGLSSGHVQTYRLPSDNDSSPSPPAPNGSAITSPVTKPASHTITKRSALRRDSSRDSSSPSLNGFGTIDTVWRTRRHKGSCRSLTFSTDGASLYSAGTDGLIKAASTETGQVFNKIALASSTTQDTPSIINAISPQTFLLATDTGAVHLYDLRDGHLSAKPQRTLNPHRTEDDQNFAEPITSLTTLPPSAASTSGTSRQFVTTAGSSVAACDLRKGVLGVSVDQGDVVTTSTCLPAAVGGSGRQKYNGATSSGPSEMILAGGTSGTITLWERGQYIDRIGRIIVHDSSSLPSGDDDDGSVDCLARLPSASRANSGRFEQSNVVVAGLGTGAVRFVEIRGKGGRVIGEVRHDETGVEGVGAIGFDVVGRMISAGGEIVKVWHELAEGEESVEGEDEDPGVEDSDDQSEGADNAAVMGDGEENSDNEEVDDSDSDEAPKKKKRRKKGKGRNKGGSSHGITGISGLV